MENGQCITKVMLHISQNDSKWFVIADDQEGIMNGYCLKFLPVPEDRAHQKSTFLLFSNLLKLRPEDIIKTEQQVPPCLKCVICISKYLWILGDDFSNGFKLLPGKITFGICFTLLH